MGITNVILLLGGVALFLFGMGLMGDSLKKVAGAKLEIILYKLTSTPLKGVLLGTVVTAVIQSSSATSAMVVGFVNSGMMKLTQAIGIVMGANIGTSITGWILCLSSIEGGGSGILSLLSTSNLAALVAVIGILLRMLGKNEQKKHVGDILLGFAVLMYGMQSMSSAVSPLRKSETFIQMMTMFENPILGLLVGTLVTAVLQSNSASVGILQALAVTGAISFATAFPVIMGMGIGAAVPVLMSAIGANRDSKRTALIYLFTDLIGAIIISIVFYSINAVVRFGFMDMVMTPVSIALVNSLFRIVAIFLLAPFINQLEKLTGWLIKGKGEQEDLAADVDRLEERFLPHPALALEQSRMTINSMALRSQDNLADAFKLLKEYSKEGFQTVVDLENAVDKYEDRLGNYLVKITGRDLSQKQTREVSVFLHTIGDFERISDHALNIAEAAQEISEKSIQFSEDALRELGIITSAIEEIVSLTVRAFTESDLELAARVEPLEDIVDGLCDEIKLHHVLRVQEGQCTLGQGFVFNDILTNYERVADHCSNIAVAMMEQEYDFLDTHQFLKSMKELKSEHFVRYSEEYSKRFSL